MSIHKLRLHLSKEVLNVKLLVIEGVNCITAIKPNGSGWDCDLPRLDVGSDRDVDLAAFVEGIPNTKCTLEIQIDEQPKKTLDAQFSTKGNALFNKTIKLVEEKNT